MSTESGKAVSRVVIETVPHSEQRYNTVGDWFFRQEAITKRVDIGLGGPKFDIVETLVVRVSDTGNWRWNMALALHEFAEAILCTSSGVSQDEVDKWDMEWSLRQHLIEDLEPGDDVNAPYHKQHREATALEMEFHQEFSSSGSDAMIDWQNYEDKLEELVKGYGK